MEKPRTRKILIWATTVLSLGTLVGLPLALTSVFLFDAPGSEKNPATIMLFVSALTAPVVSVLAIVLAWILYATNRLKAACWITLLPLVNLVGGGVALAWLEIFNSGRLS